MKNFDEAKDLTKENQEFYKIEDKKVFIMTENGPRVLNYIIVQRFWIAGPNFYW